MPGWINVPLKTETHERLKRDKNNDLLSFDKFVNELLDLYEKSKIPLYTEKDISQLDRTGVKHECASEPKVSDGFERFVEE